MFVGNGTHPLDKQFRLGRFFGIPLYLHMVLVIFLGFELFSALLLGNLSRLIWLLILMLSVYLHELGHSLSSAHFGARPHRIVLHLFGGVAETPATLNESQRLWVIAWGPIVSLILTALGTMLAFLFPFSSIGGLGASFATLNFILFIFNVLPIFPLDGGQWLRTWMSLRIDHYDAIRRTLPLSMATLIAAGMLGLVFYHSIGGPFALIIATFLLFINHQEWTRWRHLFQGERGFWGYLNPFAGGYPRKARQQGKTQKNKKVMSSFKARFHIFWYKNRAEFLMKKSDNIGVINLPERERAILSKYLDAKLSLRSSAQKTPPNYYN